MEDNMYACIYEDGSLMIISGDDELSKGLISHYITVKDPNIDVSLN